MTYKLTSIQIRELAKKYGYDTVNFGGAWAFEIAQDYFSPKLETKDKEIADLKGLLREVWDEIHTWSLPSESDQLSKRELLDKLKDI